MKMHLSDWCHIDLKGSGLTVIGWLLEVNWSEQHFKTKTVVMDRIIGTKMKQINPFIWLLGDTNMGIHYPFLVLVENGGKN